MGIGEQIPASKIGDKVSYVARVDGREQKIVCKDTKYVTAINVNLMCLTTVMNQGYDLLGKQGTISTKKNGNKFIFNNEIKSSDGVPYGIQIGGQPKSEPSTNP